jgi:hypothetical protein
MEFITAPRRGGKSYWLAQELKRDLDARLVTPNHAMKRAFLDQFKDEHFSGRVFTLTESQHMDGFDRSVRRVYFDEVNVFLQSLMPPGWRLTTVTATGRSRALPPNPYVRS